MNSPTQYSAAEMERMEFEAGVRAALSELKTTHTAFYSERPTRFPPQHTINATLSEVTVATDRRGGCSSMSLKTARHRTLVFAPGIYCWQSMG